MKLSVLDSAKVIYEARRALRLTTDEDVAGDELPFEQLTSEAREPLLAEINANRQSGEPMQDAIGQAIEDALK